MSISSSPGIIEHRDRPHSPIRYFTQEDINQGQILYRPPAAPPHLQEITAFSFAGNTSVSALRHQVSLNLHGWFPSLPKNLSIESLPTLFSLFKITWDLSTCFGLGSDLCLCLWICFFYLIFHTWKPLFYQLYSVDDACVYNSCSLNYIFEFQDFLSLCFFIASSSTFKSSTLSSHICFCFLGFLGIL